MFERFTKEAIKVIMLAQEESRRVGHNSVGTEQLLLGIIGERTSDAAKALSHCGIDLKKAREGVEKITGRGSGFVAVEIPFTPRAKRVLDIASQNSTDLRRNYIGPEHLLIGILGEGQGVAYRVIENLSDIERVRSALERYMGLADGAGIATYASPPPPQPCHWCGEEIREPAIVCKTCDRPVIEEAKRCPHCAEVIWKIALLCRFCGSNLPENPDKPATAELLS